LGGLGGKKNKPPYTGKPFRTTQESQHPASLARWDECHPPKNSSLASRQHLLGGGGILPPKDGWAPEKSSQS